MEWSIKSITPTEPALKLIFEINSDWIFGCRLAIRLPKNAGIDDNSVRDWGWFCMNTQIWIFVPHSQSHRWRFYDGNTEKGSDINCCECYAPKQATLCLYTPSAFWRGPVSSTDWQGRNWSWKGTRFLPVHFGCGVPRDEAAVQLSHAWIEGQEIATRPPTCRCSCSSILQRSDTGRRSRALTLPAGSAKSASTAVLTAVPPPEQQPKQMTEVAAPPVRFLFPHQPQDSRQ